MIWQELDRFQTLNPVLGLFYNRLGTLSSFARRWSGWPKMNPARPTGDSLTVSLLDLSSHIAFEDWDVSGRLCMTEPPRRFCQKTPPGTCELVLVYVGLAPLVGPWELATMAELSTIAWSMFILSLMLHSTQLSCTLPTLMLKISCTGGRPRVSPDHTWQWGEVEWAMNSCLYF